MNNVDEDWREVDKEDMSNDDIMEFLRIHCTFSVNINAPKSDINTRMWIKKHSNWILDKKPGK